MDFFGAALGISTCITTLNPNVGIPETNTEMDTDYNPYESSAQRLLDTWKKGQTILNSFWRLWRDGYLLSLRERTQVKLKTGRIQSQYTPNIGDVVLVKDDVPRGSWTLGRIVSLSKSKDGEIRSAKVHMSSGRLLGRPLNLLYPIEVSGSSGNKESITGKSDLDTKNPRPKRIASERAKRSYQTVIQYRCSISKSEKIDYKDLKVRIKYCN